MMKQLWRMSAILIVFCAFLAACDKLVSTPIGKIAENPREYAGKSVTITGEVTDVFSLFVLKYFAIRDDTGQIIVISDKPLPKKGTTLTVKGRIEEAFSVGDQQLLVLIEDKEER